MKKLLIVRHAKSSWEHPELADFDRPLNSRGQRNCPEMASRLQHRGLKADVIYASAARRAFETAKGIAPGLDLSALDIIPQENLYHATVDLYTDFVRDLPNYYQSVVIVGHNPDITDWVNTMCNSQIENIPTLGMALIEFEAEAWENAGPEQGSLVWYDYPKKPQESNLA
ncbi:MAG: histidine phosphatase family protein [Bacteroidota bacterium]